MAWQRLVQEGVKWMLMLKTEEAKVELGLRWRLRTTAGEEVRGPWC